jgi:hypothetical protein
MNIFLGDFNTKEGREELFKLTIVNDVYTQLAMVMQLE